jgi:hypothetical protein
VRVGHQKDFSTWKRSRPSDVERTGSRFRGYETPVELHIERNAVILSDGLLIRANDHSSVRDLFRYVQARQDWYRGIIGALEAGQSVAVRVSRAIPGGVTNRMHAARWEPSRGQGAEPCVDTSGSGRSVTLAWRLPGLRRFRPS